MDKTVILHKRILKNWPKTVDMMGADLRTMCWVDDQFFYFTKKIIKRVEQKLTKHEATFDKFWYMYPKKTWKKSAEIKFMLLKESDFDNLFAWLKQYLKKWDNRIKTKNKEFIPNPAAWLHQERWNDEIDIWEDATNSLNRDRAKAEKNKEDKKEALAKIEANEMKKKIANKVLELHETDPHRLERIKAKVTREIEDKNPNARWTFRSNLFNLKLKAIIKEHYFNN